MNTPLDKSLSTRATAKALGTTHPTISRIAKTINQERAQAGLLPIGKPVGQSILYTPSERAIIKPLIRTQQSSTEHDSSIWVFAFQGSDIPEKLLSLMPHLVPIKSKAS